MCLRDEEDLQHLELNTLDVLLKADASVRELFIEANNRLCVDLSVLCKCCPPNPSKGIPHPTEESSIFFFFFKNQFSFFYLETFQDHSTIIFWKYVICISGYSQTIR